jgi:hypothetical protein
MKCPRVELTNRLADLLPLVPQLRETLEKLGPGEVHELANWKDEVAACKDVPHSPMFLTKKIRFHRNDRLHFAMQVDLNKFRCDGFPGKA